MRCHKCGFENSENSKYCQKCGNSLSDNYRNRNYNTYSHSNGTMIVTVVLSVILFLGVIVIGYLAYRNRVAEDALKMQTEQSLENKEKEIAQREQKVEQREESVNSKEENVSEREENVSEREENLNNREQNINNNPYYYIPANDELFPSDRVYISESDLRYKTKSEVALIRNEIYARHGYIFNKDIYRNYFGNKSWYYPNESFSESDFNVIEKTNKEYIISYEKKMGWR